jgi:hypothetical protein
MCSNSSITEKERNRKRKKRKEKIPSEEDPALWVGSLNSRSQDQNKLWQGTWGQGTGASLPQRAVSGLGLLP